MEIQIYQVDAFATDIFEGNPAAVCPLDSWLPDEVMQHIAMENNLSETAFFVRQETGTYRLRWFTPATEVDLCGHATLASAHVLFEHLGFSERLIRFASNSGELTVIRSAETDRLTMNFPACKLDRASMPEQLEKAVGIPPQELYKDTDYLYVVGSEEEVQSLDPDIRLMKTVNARGIIVTAAGEEYDFVSRFFAPAAGVDEDPVTGSAHTMLTPYWSRRLGRKKLVGRQISSRGGTVYCEDQGDRVSISGTARTFMQGQIEI